MPPKPPPEEKKSPHEFTVQECRNILMNAPVGIAMSTPGGRLLNANPYLAKMLGYATVDEFIGSIENIATHIYVNNGDRDEFKRLLQENNEIVNYECPLFRKDKSILWVSINARAMRGKQGNISKYKSFFSDITKRKQSESDRAAALSELMKVTNYYRNIFEACLDPLIAVDPDGVITDANKATEETLGHSREDIIGTKFSDHFEEAEKAQSLCDLVLREKRLRNYTFKLSHRKGSRIVLIYNLSPYLDESGEIVGVLAAARDITERIEMEEQLECYADGLEELINKRTAELEGKRQALEEMNAALNVLLQKRDEDKVEIQRQFVLNIKELVIPYIEKIRIGTLDARQQTCLDIVEKNLNEVASPFLKELYQHNLTPRESQVAALVRDGKTTKEIAGILGLAAGSVDVHRKGIRKKLKMNRTINLRSHLSVFD